jgi:hypothetical protein
VKPLNPSDFQPEEKSMKWKEILIGGCFYLLVILSGYGIPFFIHVVKRNCPILISMGKAETAVWDYTTQALGFRR